MKPLRLPPGFRFLPSESELIMQYLKKKINGEALPILNLIKDRDLYGNESPSQIFQTCSSCFDSSVFDNWLYFFTKIKKKSINNPSTKRIDRIAGNGTWKLQKTYNVFDENSKSLLIGYRSAFNFVAKSKLETNNNEEEQYSWIMHEFTMKGSIWALCKLRKGNLLKESKYEHVIPSTASKRKRVVPEIVDDDDDDDDKKKKKKRTCCRGSSSKSNIGTTLCDEGLMGDVDSNDDHPQPGYDTLVAAQLGDQCGYSGDDEKIWKSVSTDPLGDLEYLKALEILLA